MLTNHIKKELIITQLDKNKKQDVIKVMVSKLKEHNLIKDEKEFTNIIKKRESIETTAIGDGIAIPHGISDTVNELSIVIGRSIEGAEFKSIDKKIVNLIFMIASNPSDGNEYLKTVAKIARMMKTKDYKREIMEADDPEEVIRIIKRFDESTLDKISVNQDGRVIHANGEGSQ